MESEVPEWREIEMCGAVPSPREGHLMQCGVLVRLSDGGKRGKRLCVDILN